MKWCLWAVDGARVLLALALLTESASSTDPPSHTPEPSALRTLLPIATDECGYNKHDLLYFNISSIAGDEDVTKVRLHLHRRKMLRSVTKSTDPQKLPDPAHVLMYHSRSTRSQPRRFASVPISPRTLGGWTQLDLTSEFNEIHGLHRLIAIRFEGPNGAKLTAKSFLKRVKPNGLRPSNAYMVVFSKHASLESLETPKERHMKHKVWKPDDNSHSNDVRELHLPMTEVRHNSKRKVRERRTKLTEKEQTRKRELRIVPFLHINEMADMQRNARRYKRSLLEFQSTRLESQDKRSDGAAVKDSTDR